MSCVVKVDASTIETNHTQRTGGRVSNALICMQLDARLNCLTGNSYVLGKEGPLYTLQLLVKFDHLTSSCILNSTYVLVKLRLNFLGVFWVTECCSCFEAYISTIL